ncbi:RNA polymerase sigma factor SigJ [Asticcacaulis sp. BYS171W]|uniref:RNA polymerase sigma factor SigJ n=1 Tax=Asticcacaulis aquaticus TaxID=2984212 RepID=A0ABT5HUV1_9CAUL|nr:RNA polymerase sigma factor SigJ [Asticcacaulis aquaticus]MDC7683848.1 RNA polymerase sigma factor SigJ [Asticcacaulis aquaticus]
MNVADFELHRRYLVGVAYRMLGTLAEAEDVVQDAFLRVRDQPPPEHPRAYLTRVVTRLCLDVLKSAHRQRMTYVGPWLPEPLHDVSDFTGARAGDDLSDDLSIGLLYALERLSPLERAAFLLHDVFGVGFTEIASTLDRSEAACRQLAARARRAVRQSHAPQPARFAVTEADERAFLQAFLEASQSGDVSVLEALLTRDVKLHSDGGGKASAAINILEGRDRVLKFMIGIYQKFRQYTVESVEFVRANGALAVLSYHADGTTDLLTIETVEGRIANVYFIRNPDKMKTFHPPLHSGGGGAE